MALDFPSPASTGTAYTGTNGIIYIYDGIKWVGWFWAALGPLNLIKLFYILIIIYQFSTEFDYQ